MGATLLRVLKWALLGWATLSLLGVATLGTLIWLESRRHAGLVEGTAALTEQQRIAEAVAPTGLAADDFERIDRRYCASREDSGGIQAYRLRTRPTLQVEPEGAGWIDIERPPVHVVAALRQADSRMRATGQAWLPSPSALAGNGYRVHADVGYEGAGVDSFELLILQPRTRTAWHVQGWNLNKPMAGRWLAGICEDGA
jgi:hypothetical protein